MAYWTEPPVGDAVAGSGPPDPAWIAVIVPAHNEEQLVAQCLASVHRAAEQVRDTAHRPPAVTVVAVLDDCSDRTERIVAADSAVHALRVRHRQVGAARRAGAQHAIGAGRARAGWLASTDADSEVPGNWLTGMLGLARAGADLVLGTVEPSAGLQPSVLLRYRSGYHQWNGHGHVHGANLGISVDAYRSLGGWPARAFDEDVALVRRAEAAGLAIARTAAIPVRTSSRQVGRAPSGYAAYLAALAEPVS